MRAKFPPLLVKILKYRYPTIPFNNTVLLIPFLLLMYMYIFKFSIRQVCT